MKHQPLIAVIREPECIGCTKCIKACPVDAIIGASKHMHTVIPNECIGCKLCVAPCPVDCIDMVPVEKPLFDKQRVQQRVTARKKRLLEKINEPEALYHQKKLNKHAYLNELMKRNQ